MGRVENDYLEEWVRLKVYWGCINPQVHIENEKVDGEIFYIHDIKIEAFLVPGHTYSVFNRWCVFVYWNTIWSGADGGYAFTNTLAEDRKLQSVSVETTRRKKLRNLSLKIITGHTGWTDDFEFAFAMWR